MGNEVIEVSDHSTIVDAKRSSLSNINTKMMMEKLHFVKQTEVLEILNTDYISKLEKRNPSNELSFARITSGLLLLDENLTTVGSKLSLIEQEILLMEKKVDSTNDRDTNIFLDQAKGVLNLLVEVEGKTKRNLELIMDSLQEFIAIES